MTLFASTDPETFARGSQTCTLFFQFDEGRGDPNNTRVPISAIHKNVD